MSAVIDRPDRRRRLHRRLLRIPARMGSCGTWLRLARDRLTEYLAAKRLDLGEFRRRQPRLIRVLVGADALAPSSSVAIYVHYAPTPAVSAMVLSQLDAYRALGFWILFVSMAPRLSDFVVRQVAGRVGIIVQRRNVGIDFGAWQDMLPFLELASNDPGSPGLRELLLVNDSVCGPLRPLRPIVEDMRASGDGFFGMTESLAPCPHLQSYFLLACGAAAIADVVTFLARYRPTAYKWQVIQRGELGLTTWMRQRGHTVAARFGYEPVERAALTSPNARQRLRTRLPAMFAGVRADQQGAYALRLQHNPLNPTHFLWRELVEVCGFPFLKTDLLLRNPIGIPDLDGWPSLLRQQGQRTGTDMALSIERHLALMRQADGSRGAAA